MSMKDGSETKGDRSSGRMFLSVGTRLTVWILFLFVVTMIVFVGLDIRHEASFAESLGAGDEAKTALFVNTLALHSVHLCVTVLVFGLAIHLLVRRLVSRRIAAIVLAVQHFQRGSWHVNIPVRVRDEIEWLTEAFRQLGPDIERKLSTFVGADRKSVVALLGSRYEERLRPPARRILAMAREYSSSGPHAEVWCEIEEQAMRILAEVGSLGRPDHPVAADIVNLGRTDAIVSGGSRQERTGPPAGDRAGRRPRGHVT